jgi:hypothetical protein
MKTVACLRPACLCIGCILSGCMYVPMTVAPSSYQFDRHPGVSMEMRPVYGYEMSGQMATYLVNRSNVDKCAWTQYHASRLLRAGDTWMVSEMQSPGTIGVANVVPSDPNCMKAKGAGGP